MHFHSEQKVNTDKISQIVSEYFDKEGKQFTVQYDSAKVKVRIENQQADFNIIHPFDTTKLESELEILSEKLDDEVDPDIHYSGIRSVDQIPNYPKNFVLDTNAIYLEKQNKSEGQSIAEFIVRNPIFTEKKLILPWQVNVELNRHFSRDGGPSRKVIEQGKENLKMLNTLDRYGLVDLHNAEIPTKMDESMKSNRGSVDLAILGLAEKEDAAIITGDKSLQLLSSLRDVEVFNLNQYIGEEESPGQKAISDIRDRLRHLLQQSPIKVDNVEKQIRSEKEGEFNFDNLEVTQEELLDSLKSADQIVECPKEDDICIFRSKRVDIVPTPEALRKINEITVDYAGQKYLNLKFLRKLAEECNLGENTVPKVDFKIPKSYVLNEVGHGKTEIWKNLMTLTELSNSEFTSVNVNEEEVSDYDLRSSLKIAEEVDGTLLCTSSEETLYNSSKILELDTYLIS